ncbi:MAG: alpha/beta hydrolase [Acidimicrobiales bacterium]
MTANESPAASPHYVDSTDGVRVAYHDFGGSGPLLLLSHATGFCAGVWQPMAENLTDHFRCVGIDYRGHGYTITPAETTMAWTGMANDLLSVVDALVGDEPVFVAGHSMGGAALVLADRLRPGTVAKAWGFEPILYDAAMMATVNPEDPSRMTQAAQRRRASFESREAVYERYAAKPPLNMLDPRALRAYVDYGFRDLTSDDPDHAECPGGVTLRCTPAREAETFANARSGAFEALADIEFDYRVLMSGDGMPPALMAEHAAESWERIQLARYPELTHFGPLEQPELMATDVLEWFSVAD